VKVGDTTYLFPCMCGKTLCAEPNEYIECCRERVQELLAEEHHQIEFRNDGWTVSHPMRERLNGTLFDCEMRWDMGDIGYRGRFELDWDEDGQPVVGAKIEEAT